MARSSLSLRPLALWLATTMATVAGADAAGPAGAPTPWPAKYYNSKPLDEDLLLPLPCGGALAFRRVLTPAPPEPLADREIRIGAPSDQTGFSDYLRRAYIMGSFGEPGIPARFFYIGKYEVSQDQYDAVMTGVCKTPSMRGSVPKSNISWFDATVFGQRLTEWIYANHPDRMPTENGVRGFLRLPTEIEWEYAARGGAEVSEAQFRERVFYGSKPTREYVWYAGSESSGGQLRPIGLLAANPLGLHDILGNAEEFVLEPYYLNRAGREHGQPGGFVTRGGSAKEPADRIRTSIRREYSYFDARTGLALQSDTFGIRLAISAPIETDLQRVDGFRKDFNRIASFRVDEGQDPLDMLRDMAEQTTDLEAKNRLEALSTALASELRRRTEIEERALRQSLFVGAVMVRTLLEDVQRIDKFEKLIKLAQNINDQQTTRKYERDLVAARNQHDLTVRIYTTKLFQVSEDYTPAQHQSQFEALLQEFEAQNLSDLKLFAEIFKDEVMAYRVSPVGVQELIRRVVSSYH